MKLLALFVLFWMVSATVFSQGKRLRVYVDTKQFYAPSLGHLLEVNLQFSGPSVNYVGKGDGLVADVAVFLAVERGGNIIKEDAHRLESPFMKDSIIEDFYDLKRFVLDTGSYVLKLEIRDLNSDREPIKGEVPIEISNKQGRTSISNIQIAEVAKEGDENNMFYKSGYEIIPRISTYFSNDLNFLPYYVEMYNTNLLETPEFGLKQSIVDFETTEEVEEFTIYYRFKSAEVVPTLKKIDISNLQTGKYYLKLSIVAHDLSEIHSDAYLFERTKEVNINFNLNTLTVLDPMFESSISLDSARYYLGSVIPIAPPSAVRDILTVLKNDDEKKAFLTLQAFWSATAGTKAYTDWIKYKGQVDLVNTLYKTHFLSGYESDRGRVYLQYGSPTQVIQSQYSASEYPYEIWQYNKIGRFSNKRFIFYNSDLVTENYRLLHSDMIGEIKNQNWPRALNSRNSTNGDVDNGNGGVDNHWGGNSNTNFRQF